MQPSPGTQNQGQRRAGAKICYLSCSASLTGGWEVDTGWAEGLRSLTVQATGKVSHGDCEPQGYVSLSDSRVRSDATHCLLSVEMLNQSTEWDLQGSLGLFKTKICPAEIAMVFKARRKTDFFQKWMFSPNLIYKWSRKGSKEELVFRKALGVDLC